ncbi:MAG: hypothetical protein HDQ88_04245, partial [Clostridia bacterium]|nr:hypothetical protein [Clostridia bacterium]
MIYQKKKKTIKLITLVFGFFIIFFSLLAGRGAYSTHASASADNENIKFDTTNVLDDLRGMTIDGKAFTLEDYPKDDDGSVKLISLAEYCYSYYGDMQQNYGLYVYVYNPQQMTFDCKSDKNKLQMRVGGKDTDDYTKYSLQFLDGTLLDGLENRFYKFKINFTSAQRQAVLSALNAESRIYEVSGIELLNNKSDDYPNATEYPCGFFNKETGVYSAPKYVYSGYSKGYGQTSSEETLDCTISDVEA